MADLTAHERFLRGDPLNEELAALQQGREAKTERKPAAVRRTAEDAGRELSRLERLDLKEWMEMPGWELFLRLTEKATNQHQKRAIANSGDDPLLNRDRIAAEWAYVKMFQRAAAELEAMVYAEVAELENER